MFVNLFLLFQFPGIGHDCNCMGSGVIDWLHQSWMNFIWFFFPLNSYDLLSLMWFKASYLYIFLLNGHWRNLLEIKFYFNKKYRNVRGCKEYFLIYFYESPTSVSVTQRRLIIIFYCNITNFLEFFICLTESLIS